MHAPVACAAILVCAFCACAEVCANETAFYQTLHRTDPRRARGQVPPAEESFGGLNQAIDSMQRLTAVSMRACVVGYIYFNKSNQSNPFLNRRRSMRNAGRLLTSVLVFILGMLLTRCMSTTKSLRNSTWM